MKRAPCEKIEISGLRSSPAYACGFVLIFVEIDDPVETLEETSPATSNPLAIAARSSWPPSCSHRQQHAFVRQSPIRAGFGMKQVDQRVDGARAKLLVRIRLGQFARDAQPFVAIVVFVFVEIALDR